MRTPAVLDLLRKFESRNVTYIEADGSWPIVWDRARGMHVWDVEGRKYLDLTAAFGVAAAGHANPRVVQAGQKQMARLLHAMGDVHPHALKALLARQLSRITFERWTSKPGRVARSRSTGLRHRAAPLTAKTIFCVSGFEAVEVALKTALLASGVPGVIAFTGAYHGLGYGALNTTHRDYFRSPFRRQLREFASFVPFPAGEVSMDKIEARIRNIFRRQKIGAILVEPIQVRGGMNVPPVDFLPRLRQICDRENAVLILDEIYTGVGRTGRWFACEHTGTVPDLICVGKALTGGFPLSACIGRADLMDAAWPASPGEAIHTSTFLGHPVGCAMALAQIKEIQRLKLVKRSAALGNYLLAELRELAEKISSHSPGTPRRSKTGLKLDARGMGLLAGLELRQTDGKPATAATLNITKQLLRRSIITLPEGEHSNVLGFTPPLIISQTQLRAALLTLRELLNVRP